MFTEYLVERCTAANDWKTESRWVYEFEVSKYTTEGWKVRKSRTGKK